MEIKSKKPTSWTESLFPSRYHGLGAEKQHRVGLQAEENFRTKGRQEVVQWVGLGGLQSPEGGGIGWGGRWGGFRRRKTCKSMADSCQCMAKTLQLKKKKGICSEPIIWDGWVALAGVTARSVWKSDYTSSSLSKTTVWHFQNECS